MVKNIVAGVLVCALLLAFAVPAVAQEAKAKADKPAKVAATATTKSVSCAPECGFMVRSHDEKELTDIVIKHAKTAHNKDVTAADVKKMMK